jgi:hypothetical protein
MSFCNVTLQAKRRAEVAAFNKEHRFRKRGLALLPTKFGIAFTAKFMNQGGALVHLYADGSVLVSHGGTEMGQGLNTKVLQVVAQRLGVDTSRVQVGVVSFVLCFVFCFGVKRACCCQSLLVLPLLQRTHSLFYSLLPSIFHFLFPFSDSGDGVRQGGQHFADGGVDVDGPVYVVPSQSSVHVFDPFQLHSHSATLMRRHYVLRLSEHNSYDHCAML